MSAGYVANVIAHLEAHNRYFYFAVMRRQLHQMWTDLLAGRIPADIIAEALGATPLTELTAREWLEGTPLMRALRRRHRDFPMTSSE